MTEHHWCHCEDNDDSCYCNLEDRAPPTLQRVAFYHQPTSRIPFILGSLCGLGIGACSGWKLAEVGEVYFVLFLVGLIVSSFLLYEGANPQ